MTEFYGKWLYGHIAVGMFGGAIGAPLLVSYSAYENSKSTGNPIDKGAVVIGSMLSSPFGMAGGALIGALWGLPGPLSYLATGGYWWYHRNQK